MKQKQTSLISLVDAWKCHSVTKNRGEAYANLFKKTIFVLSLMISLCFFPSVIKNILLCLLNYFCSLVWLISICLYPPPHLLPVHVILWQTQIALLATSIMYEQCQAFISTSLEYTTITCTQTLLRLWIRQIWG